MTKIEFFVTMKVTCEHDEQSRYGDLTLAHVKQTAMKLIHPNYYTVENGVKLEKVIVEYHDNDLINEDLENFCQDFELE